MGRRGPPPKPTHLKVIAGNPGKRPLNFQEPQPRKQAPRVPSWLSADAKREWARVAPLLKDMGVLTVVDADALAIYVHTFVKWRSAEDFLAKHGEVYPIRDEKGQIRCMQQFPQVSISRNLLLVLRAYQQEFGLTPAARCRIHVGDGEEAPDAAKNILGW